AAHAAPHGAVRRDQKASTWAAIRGTPNAHDGGEGRGLAVARAREHSIQDLPELLPVLHTLTLSRPRLGESIGKAAAGSGDGWRVAAPSRDARRRRRRLWQDTSFIEKLAPVGRGNDRPRPGE